MNLESSCESCHVRQSSVSENLLDIRLTAQVSLPSKSKNALHDSLKALMPNVQLADSVVRVHLVMLGN